MPVVGIPSGLSGLGGLIMEIRDMIPDPVADPSMDGSAFSLATILRFINHACEEMCYRVPIIEDWYAIRSEEGMDVYELPNYIVSVEQLWYDLWPAWRAPELDALFVSKITSRSYFFGPHASHQIPKLHVWPCANRTGTETTLASDLTDAARVIPLTSVDGFKAYGFVKVEDELILYRTVNSSTNTLTQVLRGQGGTVAASHSNGTAAYECNIMLKVTRLPKEVTSYNDVLEVPQGLYPIVELGVMSHIRMAEQEFQEARELRREFDQACDLLAQRGNKLRQGTQIRISPPGPIYYGHGSRLFIP